ncbi:MAG: DNA mismatch repair endonuclease MutL [Eubacteriales bacterium]|nr:DNA mismatch repair endonuclease MutL [Eubacteriales bacterium]
MILVLDEHTANGIAAGEVVERPASVVKELLENSLDAGASRIRVEIERGGVSLIRVADNGSGMGPEDAAKSVLRHATSKLRGLDELHSIATMGFRGEALASIAAVSRLRLVTRQTGANQAFFQDFEAGKLIDSGFTAGAEGTIVEVKNLFYNTPARYKFLKKDATEAAYVTDVVERHAFSRPDISFALSKDGKQSLLTPGDGKLLSVIYSIWDSESAAAALPLKGDFEGIKVSGYVSNSHHSRKNRSRQIFIVNNRVIQSPIIRLAVDRACQGHFVKSTFPELILKLEISPLEIDVNVHPQKTELRFSNEQAIFRAVYYSIKNCLDEASGIKAIAAKPEASSDPPAESVLAEKKQQEAEPEQLSWQELNSDSRKQEHLEANAKSVELPVSEGKAETVFPSKLTIDYQQAMRERLIPQEQAKIFAEAAAITSDRKTASNSSVDDTKTMVRNFALDGARLIGQAFNTYLILEKVGQLLLLDQHAAHERILYEELLAARANNQAAHSQILMQAIVLKFSDLEIQAALDQEDKIRDLGFDFEQFSEDSLVLRAVPLDPERPDYSPERAFRAVVEEAATKTLNREADIEEALHTVACKAAVKAHDILSYQEMQSLLKQLAGLKDPFHCPHGRPVIISISQKEIEKYFERSL